MIIINCLLDHFIKVLSLFVCPRTEMRSISFGMFRGGTGGRKESCPGHENITFVEIWARIHKDSKNPLRELLI